MVECFLEVPLRVSCLSFKVFAEIFVRQYGEVYLVGYVASGLSAILLCWTVPHGFIML